MLEGVSPRERYEGFVILTITLAFEEVVVVTAGRLRKLATDSWAMFVDSAATLSRVQELAGTLEDRILAVAQHATISLDHFGETLLGTIVAEREAFREPLNVASLDEDMFV